MDSAERPAQVSSRLTLPASALTICGMLLRHVLRFAINTTRQVAFNDAILSERIIPYSFDRENALLIFDLLVCHTLKTSFVGYTLITRYE